MAELFRISLPLMISSGSQSLMNAADRMVLAGCSQDALAAVTPASMMHWTVVCVPLGTVLYANTFVSQYEGADRRDRMMASLWQAIWIAISTGLLLVSVLPLTRHLLALAGHPADVAELEAQYFNTLGVGNPIMLTATALSCYFNGQRRTTVVMIISMMAVGMNFVLACLLVYGYGPIPAMGMRGAALATVLARCAEVITYAGLIASDASRRRLPFWSSWKPDFGLLKQFIRFGVPSGLHYFVDYSGFAAFLMILGTISSESLAATNLAFSVNGLIFVPLLGFGTAIQTLVGHHLGSGHPEIARRTTRNAAIMGLIWTGTTGLILLLIPNLALQPFSLFADESQKVSMATVSTTASMLLNFVAIYSIFDALAVVYSSALRGAGDTVFPMMITLLFSWCVMVLPAWLIVNFTEPTLQKLWLTTTANIVLTGLCMFGRYKAGAWARIRMIQDTAPRPDSTTTPS